MASRQQRYIPHVRDVFQLPSSGGSNNGRRGTRPLAPLFDDRGNQHTSLSSSYEEPPYAYVDQRMANRAQHDQQYGNYGRTLTEKDVKHIERHLSMKKTIRKQLSRHLTQSYLEAESGGGGGGGGGDVAVNRSDDSRRNDKNNASTTTATTSEANFLELLKEVRSDDGNLDRDSGHCSPIDDLDVMQSQWQKNFGKQHNANAKNNNNDGGGGAAEQSTQESKKSSFWKKLTVRAKVKH